MSGSLKGALATLHPLRVTAAMALSSSFGAKQVARDAGLSPRTCQLQPKAQVAARRSARSRNLLCRAAATKEKSNTQVDDDEYVYSASTHCFALHATTAAVLVFDTSRGLLLLFPSSQRRKGNGSRSRRTRSSGAWPCGCLRTERFT